MAELQKNVRVTKEYLYAQYHLGKLSASDLARELRNWNQIFGEYEIRRSKHNLLAATQFKDVPTNRPGEQMCVTLKEAEKPSVNEAKAESFEEQAPSRQAKIKEVLRHHRHEQLFQRLTTVVIFLQNIKAISEASKKVFFRIKKAREKRRQTGKLHFSKTINLKLNTTRSKAARLQNIRFLVAKIFANAPRKRKFLLLMKKN